MPRPYSPRPARPAKALPRAKAPAPLLLALLLALLPAAGVAVVWFTIALPALRAAQAALALVPLH